MFARERLQPKPSCLSNYFFDIESDLHPRRSEPFPWLGRFKICIGMLGEHCDMSVQSRQVVAFTGLIHLQSEDAPVSDDVLSLTTTDALLQMFEA